MLSFNQFILLREHKNSQRGTYIAVQLNKESKNKLFQFVSSHDIKDMTKADSYHTTIIYSKTHVDVNEYMFDKKITGNITGWKIFRTPNSGKYCLVAIIDSKQLNEYHEDLIKNHGATHDFPSYKSHITVAIGKDKPSIPKEIPNFEIVFDDVKIKPIEK